jgi:hypothetical protein
MLLALASGPLLAEDAALPRAQQELVDAERAFVRLAAERGFRDSFYAWFADDGIAFNPHPFKVKAALAGQPSSGGPMGAVWAPVYGDVAEAGDLGWNTGPLVFEGPGGSRPARWFSSRSEAPGRWGVARVVLDVGANTPGRRARRHGVPDAPSVRQHGARGSDAGDAIAGLLATEREFLAAAASAGVGAAYASRLADDARIHRRA